MSLAKLENLFSHTHTHTLRKTTMNTIKAVRATIKLGKEEIDAFQLPDGSYVLSAKQITEIIGIRHSRVAQIIATKHGKGYARQGLDFADFLPIKFVSELGRHTGYTLAQVMFVWQYQCFKGNERAYALVMSCGTEALERRCSIAFGVPRSEQELSERFQVQKSGILNLDCWTDAL